MSVVLTILKIVGILLLFLLAIVFLLIGLILFIPIRYRMKLQVDKDVDVGLTVSYLLHFVHFTAGYSEKEAKGMLRILGIPVYNLFPSPEEKKKKEERERRRRERQERKLQNQKKQRKKKEKAGPEKKEVEGRKTNKPMGQPPAEGEMKQFSKQEQQACKQQNQPEKQICDQLSRQEQPTTEKKEHIFQKLKVFLQKVVDKLKNLKYTIIDFYHKLQHGKETLLWYVDVLSREESQRAIKKAKHQLGRMWRHVRPNMVRGCFQFGFDDPATTGDVFSKVCMLYPLYGNNIVIIPDFENSMFKGELFLKGRIQVAVLLHIAWKVLFDKEIRRLYELCVKNSR